MTLPTLYFIKEHGFSYGQIPLSGFPPHSNPTRESTVAGYRGLLWPFKIRSMAAIVFQFRVVAGAP